MSTPELDEIQRRQARLSPEKRALLESRLRGNGGPRAHVPVIPRREGTGPVPLSFGQQRLWFLDRLEKGDPAYNIAYAFRLTGALDVERLGRALTEIVRRHEVLRTRFADRGGEPVQVISPPAPVPLPVDDLDGLPEAEREPEAMRRAGDEAQLGFDLEHGPLLRCRLVRISPLDHLFLMTIHHIVFDGWSEGVFFRELRALYGAGRESGALPLQDPSLQYPDYAAWQRRVIDEESGVARLEYWKRTLAGAPPLLDLPIDFPRPAVQTSLGNSRTLPLPRELVAALEELSRREQVTLYMTLLAAFNVLLHRYSAQDDIVVGTPIAGRNYLETENAIGFFVNTLALRTDCSGDPSFRKLLMKVKEVTLGAFRNQDTPFERVVDAVHPERHASFSPLCQVLFVLQRLGESFGAMDGLGVADVRRPSRRAKFDLTLSAMTSERGMTLGIEYRSDLFAERTIEKMLGHFEALLRGIVAAPDEKISMLRMTGAAEEEDILKLGRGRSASFPVEQTYQQVFESRVRETPRALALRFGQETMTYAQLNARANRTARILRKEGVGPDTVVGVWMDRCMDLPAAFLGILKSGGAFLPLDPAYPAERLAFMVEDSAVPVIVTLSRYLSAIPRDRGRVICLDEDAHDARDESDPSPVSGPDNLAYVIYTSGSTGRPKGSEITHRSMLNHAFGIIDTFGLTPSDAVLQFFSPCFDAAVEDIFPTWAAGGTLVLRTEEIVASMSRFLDFVASERITVLRVSTAYWHELAGYVSGDAFPPAVRLVSMGGEKVRGDLVESWRRKFGTRVKVLSMYGPTETTVAAACLDVMEEWREGRSSIGRPLPNVYIYILDHARRPVPAGIAGDIYIGGYGVGRGYRRNPALTAEKFIPDPYAPRPGLRLYRSGDTGRCLPDGTIDFMGRDDNQVKVRGYRIEPGEVESVLAGHPRVHQCVVRGVSDVSGNNVLAAYCVLRKTAEEGADPVAEIGRWLAARLPGYMVPQVILPMGAIPLLPNGKTDLRALPALPRDSPARADDFAPPRDALESQLVSMWEEVLGRSRIGVYDNFFALGGHSLLAARLFGQIERRMGKNLPLATLLQAPTVDQLAAVLRKEGWQASWSSLVPIKPSGTKPPLYCVHALGGNVIGYTSLALALPDDLPVYGLQAAGLNGEDLPASTVEEMAARYVGEIRALQPSGPYFLGGACTGGIVAYEVAQQLVRQGEEIGILAMFDTFAHSYVRSLSKEELRDFKRKALKVRLRYHATNLILHPGRLTYVRKKLKTIRKRVKNRVWGLLYREYARLSIPLPTALQKVEQYHVLAIKRYNPLPYPGRITLFPPKTHSIGEFDDREQGWGSLALGGIEIHDVEGDHLSMLADPHVKSVAAQLTECLERAYRAHEGEKRKAWTR